MKTKIEWKNGEIKFDWKKIHDKDKDYEKALAEMYKDRKLHPEKYPPKEKIQWKK